MLHHPIHYYLNGIDKMIERTEMTVQRAIKKLIDEKLIRRVGSNKNGYWEII